MFRKAKGDRSEPSEQWMRLPHPAARRRPRGRVAKLTRGGRNRAPHCSRLGAPPRAASPLPSGSRVAGHSREGKGGDRGRVPQLPPAPAASPLITWAPLTRPGLQSISYRPTTCKLALQLLMAANYLQFTIFGPVFIFHQNLALYEFSWTPWPM